MRAKGVDMLGIYIIFALVFGLSLIATCHAIYRKRFIIASWRLLLTLLIFALALLAISITANLYTYRVLTNEQTVATISIKQLGPQSYNVQLKTPTLPTQNYLITGDIWQLSAQILVWQNIGQWFGLNSRYRLYRLAGNYNDLQQERTATHTVYDLTPNATWWQMMPSDWLLSCLVRTIYGGAVYMPLTDGAMYQVKLTQTGLIALPANAAAQHQFSALSSNKLW
jgi:hypothetical protein